MIWWKLTPSVLHTVFVLSVTTEPQAVARRRQEKSAVFAIVMNGA